MFALTEFSELVEINPKVSLNRHSHHPFVAMEDVVPGRRYVRASAERPLSGGSKFDPGDTLFARITPCLENGKIAQFDPSGSTSGLGSTEFIVIRARQARTDPSFAYYLASTEWVKGPAIQSMAGASGRQRARTEALAGAMVPDVPLLIQRRIASILGAYDDLIEVNRRRIAVLEEMARRLFDEWFVHFRFSGHDGHEMVETEQGRIPLGWKWEGLERVCVPRDGIQTGPFGSQLHQSDYTEEGVPVAMPKNLIGFRIVTAGIARIPEAVANSLGRHRMRTGDVVYGRRGDIGRRAYVSAHEDGWFCGTGCLRLRPDQSRIAPRYFFDALGLSQTVGSIKGRAQGATMPNLSAGAMVGVPVLVPPLALQQQYSELADTSASLTGNLVEANTRLAASRNLLLPRLISGDLSVAAAEADLESAG